mgnify:CR=1 FL=1
MFRGLLLYSVVALGSPSLLTSCPIITNNNCIAQHHHTNNNPSIPNQLIQNKNDGDEIAVTDNGNYIVDLFFDAPIADPVKAAIDIKATVGVVEHGIFANMAHCVIVAGKEGVRVAGNDGEKPWW